jgi:hypothetical protein
VIPNPIVVCRQWGYEEREGTFFAVGGSSEDGEDEAVREAQVARTREHAQVWRWLSNTMMLGTLTFPVYAAQGWPTVLGGSGSHGDRLTSLTINHYDAPDADPFDGDRSRLEITTSREDSPANDELHHARRTLHGWLQTTTMLVRRGHRPRTLPSRYGWPPAIAPRAARRSTPCAPSS